MDWPNATIQLRNYARLMRLHRPIGTLLLLWPVLWALWIAAGGVPHTDVLLVFVLGTIGMRSAGCVINDYVDRNFDGFVQRTKDRPMAAGSVSRKEAVIVFSVLLFGCALLVAQMNDLTIRLAFVGAALAIIYPFMKRFTYLPQIFLGLAFGWGIPMAFAAQTGQVPNIAWALMATAVLWALIYDTQYAMVDREDDIKIGLKSTAILFDDADRSFIGAFQIMMIISLTMIGRQAELQWPYCVALVICMGLALYQQKLIQQRNPAQCFKAFLNNNWYGAAVFVGIAGSYTLE